ncbi:hypothetical protein [Paenibacillus arenilitoris]|uniref:Uncharacterized protein n=1 Tax=Paenibacillus arenilitoris TaxID=2772299 RepID=A0A927CM14_9BACL|nr:hypothetical protein [Paenibacillus arenilitoris]MBD2869895.1 hypothetical protein [Paenibacillus arenilitoris]
MWVIFGIVVTAAGFALIEMRPLAKAGKIKELWLFALLLLAGTGLCIAVSLDAPVPNPLDLIYALFRPSSRMLELLLKE